MSNLFRDDLFDHSDSKDACDRSDKVDDKVYDPLKETDLGDPNEVVALRFEIMADMVEDRAEMVAPIDNNVWEQDGDNGEDQGKVQGKTTSGGADATCSVLGKRKGRRATISFSKPDTTMVL